MRIIIISATFVVILFASACSTNTSNLEQIQQQLQENRCKLNRQELVYKIHDLEYNNDTLYTELPFELLPDSICVCPVDSSVYLLLQVDDRIIQCPNGHGSNEI